MLALVLAAPAAAPAHDVSTVRGHLAEDSVLGLTPATERRLTRQTVRHSRTDRRRELARLSKTGSRKLRLAAAAAVSGNEGDVGQWGPLEPWPVVAIHDALLPNGKVLAWDAVGDLSYTKYTDHTYTRATVYDPATDTQTPVWVTGFDVFCAGLAHLMDGSLFLAGGNADQYSAGIVQTHTFDWRTDIWTRGADMAFPRWYPTVTALTNGEMVITSGRPWIPEVRATNGSLRTLSEQTATMDLPLYPMMNVAPDGRVFDSGPDDTLRELDASGPGSWQVFGPRGDGLNRDYGSYALYAPGKILVAGGDRSTNTALTIDINGSTPRVTPTSPMAFGRRQFNLTILPDGTVLATGGNYTGAHLVDVNGGVYNAEVWNPDTGTWKTLAAEQVTRQYHSTALLLPDGRVLSSGGGICNDCDDQGYLGKNAQIFSPPYLFKKDGSGELAPRPEILAAPDSVGYGQSFDVTTPNPAAISKMALIRLGAVTHSNNMEQRYVPLPFNADAGKLTASMPLNPNLAPPGYYMLFIVDSAGVPSVSKMVWVGNTAAPPPLPPSDQPPSVTLTGQLDGSTFTAPAAVSITAMAGDSDGTVQKVEFFNGATKLGEDTTPPYSFAWSGVGAGTYALTARATDDAGVTATTPGRTLITVNAQANQPPTVSLDQPASGATFTEPATVSLAATASDSDGSVAKVEFFNGATKLGEDTTAPYGFTWSGVGAGTYSLTAVATDDLGATATSGASTITVNPAPPTSNQAPTASITYPTNGAVFPFKPTITITATASDPDGTVTKVEFFDGTTLLGTDTSAPYSYTWKNVATGSHTLRARATDNAGATGTSAAVGITVQKKR